MVQRFMRPMVLAALAGAGLGGVAVSSALAPVPSAFADDVDDRLAELRDLVRSGDEVRVMSKIAEFEKKKDKRIDDALMAVARASGMDKAAIAAMRVLATHRDPGFLGWAKSRLYDKKMAEDRSTFFCAILDALPRAGDGLKPHMKALSDCVAEYMKSRSDITTRAVAAYASVHDKVAIDGLIAMLEDSEGSAAGGGGRGSLTTPPPTMNGGGGGNDSASNLQAAGDAIRTALKSLTGAEHGDSVRWKRWWWENQKTFKFAVAEGPEPDWATLSEFTDDAYAFVLRKPAAGKLWLFEKCQFTGGRVRMKHNDPAGVPAQLEVMTYPKGANANAAAFAATLDEAWRKSEFSEFAADGEPVVKSRKLAGREFAVITAKGIGSGTWSAWGDCERRTYVTIVGGDTILAFEGAVRAECDPVLKAAFWSGIEGVTFARGAK